jgi:DNA-binding MltR family transcriptional regulator
MAAKFNIWQFLEEGGDKVSVDREKWERALEDEKRIKVLNYDTLFDTSLKDLLMVHFSQDDKEVGKLFEPTIGGPLVSLTHKARLAYALGLIDQTLRKDVAQIHSIRNEFAHSGKMDFANDQVVKLVRRLSTAKGKSGPFVVKNSYKLYINAVKVSMTSFTKVWRQKQSMLEGLKEERKGQ